MARIQARGAVSVPLEKGWEIASTAPGAIVHPGDLEAASLAWGRAHVPGTAAAALRAAGGWAFETPRDFDATDWWFRRRIDAAKARPGETLRLALGGLATLADVFWNDEPIVRSDSMFHAHVVDVTPHATGADVLSIRFRALGPELAARRPRPRWRTRLVETQTLRAFRTTLLGRIPGWTPRVAAVGPYRPVTLERIAGAVPQVADVRSRVEAGAGIVSVRASFVGDAPREARVRVGETEGDLAIDARADGTFAVSGELRIPGAALWWPHTHGAQPLYAVAIHLRTAGGDEAFDAGRVGFRTIDADTSDGGFGLRVNGVSVFCRGACWTPLDVVSLGGSRGEYDAAIAQAAAAGMNMLRVGGTMAYEADAFYDACDAQGVLVWQDFMFANMDYPAGDAAFAASVQREARETLARIETSPCLAVLCGNSEIEQQAAMLGLPRDQWKSALFEATLPDAARAVRPDVPYVPSTPTGGAVPFQVDAGLAHYYGVGAYLRPLEDARRAGVRFTPECLGFSNVPEDETIDLLLGDGQSPAHHPVWKGRIPRDSGAGWDFEDVRDHYVAQLFGVDPMRLRYADMARYLALGRVATGEVMARTLREWRRAGSSCRGALVWWNRDLWPGAGWGLVDSRGVPKAAYWCVKRALSPVAIVASDEGLNGIVLHAINDGPRDVDARVELALYKNGETRIAAGAAPVTVPARGVTPVRDASLFEHFVDTTYAYRFGPPSHDVAVAALVDAASGARLAEDFVFPLGLGAFPRSDLGLEATARPADGGAFVVTVRSKRFAQSVAVQAKDADPDDAYFHLEPGVARSFTLRPRPGARGLKATLLPLNAHVPSKVVVVADGAETTS